MPNLGRKSGAWSGTINQTVQTSRYNFPTSNKYSDKDISLTVEIPGMNVDKGSAGTTNNFWVNPVPKDTDIPTFTFKVGSDGTVWVE